MDQVNSVSGPPGLKTLAVDPVKALAVVDLTEESLQKYLENICARRKLEGIKAMKHLIKIFEERDAENNLATGSFSNQPDKPDTIKILYPVEERKVLESPKKEKKTYDFETKNVTE